MSGTTPRRRHSPAVYRRRRLVVGLIALAVISLVVWMLVAQPWRGIAASATGPTPSPAASTSAPTPTPTAPESPSAEAPPAEEPAPEEPATEEPATDETPTAEPCTGADLLVEALTDKGTYAQGENPQLSIRLTNRTEAACTMNVGTSAQSFTIMSGSDVWWRSTDCQVEPSDMVVLLEAGQQVTSAAPLTWDRTRSSVDTCDTERQLAPGGGASYHLSVAVGGISSSNAAQFLLY